MACELKIDEHNLKKEANMRVKKKGDFGKHVESGWTS